MLSSDFIIPIDGRPNQVCVKLGTLIVVNAAEEDSSKNTDNFSSAPHRLHWSTPAVATACRISAGSRTPKTFWLVWRVVSSTCSSTCNST